MRVDNNYDRYTVNNAAELPDRKNNQYDRAAAESLINTGVSMEISQRGFALAGKLEPFIDTYETTCRLLKDVGHIGSERMINGTFADVLVENYQNELQKLKENYSGDEFDKQLAALDKAYEDASSNAALTYTKQLMFLTGDIVIKPQSFEEAQKVNQENLVKNTNNEKVIDAEQFRIIHSDVTDILLKLKNDTQNQQDKENNIWGTYMSYADIKRLGPYLHQGSYDTIEGVSDFSKSILERYAAIRAGK
ncbi:MAG: hypothetical protein HFH14_05245 [Lachnospiraceae bacterium]|nr:hypothetical protein [Lachnospiraceae bacterium]